MKLNSVFQDDIRLMSFPLLFIFLYEIFHIKCYFLLANFSHLIYFLFVLSQGVSSWIAGWIADRVSRFWMLAIIFPIAVLEFVLLFNGYHLYALLISPLFCSTTVAKADIIFEHRHRSIKDLMCIAFIFLFIPWAFFEWIGSAPLNNYVYGVLGAIAVSGLFRIFRPRTTQPPERVIQADSGSVKHPKKILGATTIFLSLSLLLAQSNFFSIAEGLESFHPNTKSHIFDLTSHAFTLMGRLCLIGSILALINRGNHKDLIFSAYSFLVMFSLASFFATSHWGLAAWSIAITLSSGFGGFYLPIITEQYAKLMGRKHYGLSIGITELLMALGSILAGLVLIIQASKVFASLYLVVSSLFALASYIVFSYLTHKPNKGSKKKKSTSKSRQ